MVRYYLLLILLIAACISSCQNKKLQNFEYSEIQSLVLDSAIGKSYQWKSDSLIMDYKQVLNIDIADTLELSKLRKDKNFFELRWLDTTKQFVREEFNKLIQANEKSILNDSAERKLDLKSKEYVLNITKESRAEYYSNDTIGKLTFYPLLYNNACNNAIEICVFHKGMEWGFCQVYFLKKINKTWNIVGRNMLWIS